MSDLTQAAMANLAGVLQALGARPTSDTVPSQSLVLTECGSGLGTSLFLRSTTEQSRTHGSGRRT